VKQKVKVVYSEKETVYQYDGDNILLEKQGSTTTATYTYGNALVRKDGATPLFDGLGSERTVTNATGAVQGTLTMTAFGQPVASSGSSTDPYEFGATSGYRSDGDGASELPSGGSDGDGLVKVGCRYYDPATGSFVSRDTDINQDPYVYCDGDPVNELDPSGHGAPFKPGPYNPDNDPTTWDYHFTKADMIDIGNTWQNIGNVEMGLAGFGAIPNTMQNPNWKPGSGALGARNMGAARLLWVVAIGGFVTKSLGQYTVWANK
jgi:RHS repeat-associated protein